MSQRSTEKSTEYYVHYLDQDRRLDAWIDASSVILTTTVPSEKMNGVKAVTSTPAPAQDRLAQEHLSVTRIRNVENVVLGQYEITTWYYSPYPEEYHDCKRLYVCDGCLRYMKSMDTLSLHKRTCGQMHPPGEKIYEKGSLRVWRVDGAVDKVCHGMQRTIAHISSTANACPFSESCLSTTRRYFTTLISSRSTS